MGFGFGLGQLDTLSGVTRMLEFFSDSSDSDLEGCQGICFIVCVQMYVSLLLSSSSFLLNLVLSCINETLVKEMLRIN